MVEEVDKYIHLNLIRFVLALISHSDVIHALAKSAKEYISTPSYVYKHLKSQKVYTANLIIQPLNFAYKRLLNKPYKNEVTLT